MKMSFSLKDGKYMNKKQKDIEMFGSNNEGKYVLSNVLLWIVIILSILTIVWLI